MVVAYAENKGHSTKEKSMYEIFTFGILLKLTGLAILSTFLKKLRISPRHLVIINKHACATRAIFMC